MTSQAISGDFTALSNFYQTLIRFALNEFVKNVVVYSQINNLNAPLSDFVSLTQIASWLFEFKFKSLEVIKNNPVTSFKKLT